MNALRRLWELLTKDVSSAAVEKFVRDEIPGAYSFFRRNLADEDLPKGNIRRFFRLSWLFFLLFLEKLTPIRRLLFGVAVLFFFVGRFNENDQASFVGFMLLGLVLVLEVADKLLTKSELIVAREIQLSLLPPDLVAPEGFRVAAYTEVANSVGGDYYDTIATPGGSVLYALADVSGKGISAALYTTTVQTALRIFSETTQNPVTLLERIDDHMRGRMRRAYFLTMVLFLVDGRGKVRIARAGHPRPVHVSAKTRKATALDVAGVAIGMASARAKGKRGQGFESGSCTMGPGDLLVSVSDGVVETVNADGEEYGERRLLAFLELCVGETADSVRERLISDLREFRRGQDLRDDSTFLILKKDA